MAALPASQPGSKARGTEQSRERRTVGAERGAEKEEGTGRETHVLLLGVFALVLLPQVVVQGLLVVLALAQGLLKLNC
jgi:hypothetical protein